MKSTVSVIEWHQNAVDNWSYRPTQKAQRDDDDTTSEIQNVKKTVPDLSTKQMFAQQNALQLSE